MMISVVFCLCSVFRICIIFFLELWFRLLVGLLVSSNLGCMMVVWVIVMCWCCLLES